MKKLLGITLILLPFVVGIGVLFVLNWKATSILFGSVGFGFLSIWAGFKLLDK